LEFELKSMFSLKFAFKERFIYKGLLYEEVNVGNWPFFVLDWEFCEEVHYVDEVESFEILGWF